MVSDYVLYLCLDLEIQAHEDDEEYEESELPPHLELTALYGQKPSWSEVPGLKAHLFGHCSVSEEEGC